MFRKGKNPRLLQLYREKVIRAEERIAWVRLFVIAINTYVFFALLPADLIKQQIALPILIASIIYSVGVLFIKPFRNIKTVIPSYLTTIADALLICLWVYSTGNYHSPFYLLWMVSIIAVAYRYMIEETIIMAGIYIISYAVILAIDNGQMSQGELVLRFSYIGLAAVASSLMSIQTLSTLNDKVQLENSERELVYARDNLRKEVAQRTRELHKANEQLREEIKIKQKYEKNRDELLQNLEQKNKELENFAYIVSHDLKAPLRGISTLADWIKADLGDNCSPEVIEKFNLLRQRVLKLKGLIDAILKLSRTDKLVTEKTLLHPGEVVREISDLLHQEKRINLVVKEPLEPVWFDKTALFQVLENLISNAQKYGPDEDCVVVISSQRKDGKVMLSVEDNGPGIPIDLHDKIFEIFNTGNSTSRDSTGVGLAIVKRIIEKSGGKVWLDKEVNQGCRFCIEIPDETT